MTEKLEPCVCGVGKPAKNSDPTDWWFWVKCEYCLNRVDSDREKKAVIMWNAAMKALRMSSARKDR